VRVWDTLLLSLRSVFQTPLRSVLTVLGLGIGIGAIMAVTAIGDAGQVEVESQLARIGVGRAWIRPAQGEERALAREDAQLVREAVPASGVITSAVAYRAAPLLFRDEVAQTLLVGCEPELATIEGLEIRSGRFLHPGDAREHRAVVVLSREVAEALFGHADPLGQRVDVAGRRMRVIGVAGDADIGEMKVAKPPEQANRAWLPLQVFEGIYGAEVHEIALSVFAAGDPLQAGEAGARALAQRYGGQYQTTTYQAEMDAARSILRIFLLVMACVAVICMAVGGIGVMNIMLVSVRERRREIGVLKALGASRGTICLQFLFEAVIYALMGGALGMLSGGALTLGAQRLIGILIPITPRMRLAALAFACVIGLFFGVYPALRAARMEPVEALRTAEGG